MVRWLAVLGCSAALVADAAAQSGVPPLGLPTAAESVTLANGTAVSRPLQPVIETIEVGPACDTLTKPVEVTAPAREAEPLKPLGSSWSVYEYLLWWPKSAPLPPLATAARGAAPPVLGGPTTGLLIGGSKPGDSGTSGGRFTWGWAVNEDQTAGLEITYLFLATAAESYAAAGALTGPPRTVGRPVVNPQTGAEDVVLVSSPGGLVGTVTASTTSRMTGWEITGVANLFANPSLRLNALAGYRYFMLNEGLRVEQAGWRPPGAAYPGGMMLAAADQFDTQNRFHGGQLGLHADLTRGSVFVEMAGKVGLGQAIEVVNVSGQSITLAPGSPLPLVQTYQGGVLGQPSNGGRFVRSVFAVLPEASLKIGYRFRDRSRLYLGYNFLYLSEAMRPGDQVDRAVDPAAVPAFGRAGAAAGWGDRPGPVLAGSDFWVQGLLFGLEFRY